MASLQVQPVHRLAGLEALRFFCAVAVVLWHYQAYFFQTQPTRSDLPIYRLLWPFYESGVNAVPWFWVLSGFVLAMNYNERIKSGTTSCWRFFVLRFSRLYPLHIFSLILVIAMQFVFFLATGEHYRHYAEQTGQAPYWSSLLLQLFMASNWFSSVFTFNGPIWSVSVEILIYALFFVLARFGIANGPTRSIIIAVVAIALHRYLTHSGRGAFAPLVNCLACFYLGVFIWQAGNSSIGETILNTPKWRNLLLVLAATTTCIVAYLRPTYAIVFVAPTVVIAALAFTARISANPAITAIAPLGNLTYGTYLLHFPVALAFLTAIEIFGIDRTAAYSPMMLILYLVTVTALAAVSFVYLEQPAQNLLRSLRRPKASEALR